jgi:hypothetical protein
MIKIKSLLKAVKKNIKKNNEYYYMPEFLFKDDNKYYKLTTEAKILYSFLLDILANDENAKYIYFTRKDASKILRCGHNKSCITFNYLQEIGLITEVQQGLGKPNKIFLNDINIEVENEQ